MIGHDELRRALESSANHLRNNREVLDRLNVFPVPDGDTGSNMVATFDAGIEAISTATTRTIRDLSRQMIPALLTQSRGNSGFILARFFAGFFEAAEACEHLDTSRLAEGFANGSYLVKRSLFSPVEGTAITIIAAMARELNVAGGEQTTETLRRAIGVAREELFRTPDLLPVLARAGVVDSGALGFVVLMEGFLAGITDHILEREREEHYRFPPRSVGGERAVRPEFRYCTELVLSDFVGPDHDELHDYLVERGDSIALVDESGMLKLHIHTNGPEEIVAYLSQMGTVESRKIEDMQAQVDLIAGDTSAEEPGEVLVIVPGPGFVEVFRNLGMEHALVYGDALPSAGDICRALEAISSRHVVILPNNKNVLPAAMIAREESGKNVSILPTETIVQGLTAVYGYSENGSAADNLESMRECMAMAETFALYRAATTTRFDATEIVEGDYFIARGDEILAAGPDAGDTVLAALQRAVVPVEERGNITFFRGTTGTASDAPGIDELTERLRSRYHHLEVEWCDGGQSNSVLIICVE